MNRTTKLLSLVVPICAAGALFSADADAQYRPAPPAPPYPYVASYEPVYYNGYAHYWYRDRWYYRDRAGAWRWYEHEPEYLRGHRGEWERHHHGWHR
jgi:hypothetical protein